MVGGDVLERLVGAAGPTDFDGGDRGGVGQAEVTAEIALGEVTAASGDFADLRGGAGGDFDSGAEGVAI